MVKFEKGSDGSGLDHIRLFGVTSESNAIKAGYDNFAAFHSLMDKPRGRAGKGAGSGSDLVDLLKAKHEWGTTNQDEDAIKDLVFKLDGLGDLLAYFGDISFVLDGDNLGYLWTLPIGVEQHESTEEFKHYCFSGDIVGPIPSSERENLEMMLFALSELWRKGTNSKNLVSELQDLIPTSLYSFYFEAPTTSRGGKVTLFEALTALVKKHGTSVATSTMVKEFLATLMSSACWDKLLLGKDPMPLFRTLDTKWKSDYPVDKNKGKLTSTIPATGDDVSTILLGDKFLRVDETGLGSYMSDIVTYHNEFEDTEFGNLWRDTLAKMTMKEVENDFNSLSDKERTVMAASGFAGDVLVSRMKQYNTLVQKTPTVPIGIDILADLPRTYKQMLDKIYQRLATMKV